MEWSVELIARFEMSFNNKIVKVWFLTVLPILILSVTLNLILPIELHYIFNIILIITVIVHWIWAVSYNKKHNVNIEKNLVSKGIVMEEVKVAYALIKNFHNQILIVLNHEGNWSLPGGRVEADETLIEATIRETYEETGFEVKVGNLLAVNEARITKRNHHALFFTFDAQIIGGVEEIKMPHEISQIEWVTIEMANNRMPYYTEGIEKIFNSYAHYYNQGTL